VIATFESGQLRIDSTLALIHIGDAERLFRVADRVCVRLKIKDMQRAPRVASQLAGMLGPGLSVVTGRARNRTWFAAGTNEKRMMFIISRGVIVAVAAFNLVSTLVMTSPKNNPTSDPGARWGPAPRS